MRCHLFSCMHSVFMVCIHLQEMLEHQLEYERVRLEAESRKACLESQEKVATAVKLSIKHLDDIILFYLQERLRAQLAELHRLSTGGQVQ